jgi:hypothetical protein
MLDMYTDFTAVHAELGAHVEVLEIDDLGARTAASPTPRSRPSRTRSAARRYELESSRDSYSSCTFDPHPGGEFVGHSGPETFHRFSPSQRSRFPSLSASVTRLTATTGVTPRMCG